MALTLNQVLSRLRSLALSHKQINHFYFGDVPEFDAQEDIVYPGCFCEQQPGQIDTVQRLQRFNFRIFLVDLVGVSERTEQNETEVLSDMTQVAGDLIALLKNPIYQDDWIITDTSAINPVTESLGDMVAGVFMDIGISVDYLADSCQVPADDVEFDQTFDMPRTKIYTYNGTGSEGNVIPIPEMSGKQILAVWRADSYKRAVSVAPTDAGKIQVGTIQSDNGNGIIGNGSAVLQIDDGLMLNEKLDILYYSN